MKEKSDKTLARGFEAQVFSSSTLKRDPANIAKLTVFLLQGYGLRLRKGLLFSMNYETYVPQLFDGDKWRTLKGWPTQVVHSDGITIPRSILC